MWILKIGDANIVAFVNFRATFDGCLMVRKRKNNHPAFGRYRTPLTKVKLQCHIVKELR